MSILKPEFPTFVQGIPEAATAAPDASGADTALIARIANALYRGANGDLPELPSGSVPSGASTAFFDASAADSPQAIASSIASSAGSLLPAANAPAQVTPQPQGDTVALAGGFPATTSSSAVPPVHPSVVEAEPEPNTQAQSGAKQTGEALPKPVAYTRAGESVPSGTLRTNDGSGHEFGEPYFYNASRPQADASRAQNAPVPASSPSVHNASGGVPAAPESLGNDAEASAADYYFVQHLQRVPSDSWSGKQPDGLQHVRSANLQNPSLSASHSAAAPSSQDAWGRVLGQTPSAGFDIQGVRRDFPALHQSVNGKPLIWLDNAATTHKPQAVIDATSRFYASDNSNIHRAAHTLAARSTDLFEAGRESVRRFLGAADTKEIVFVRGTTEAINLVAQSYGRSHIGEGDEILLTELEHHANIVPWQILATQTGAVLRVIPINDRGELIVEKIPQLITARTKLVSVAHVSNALGTINPVREIIALAHSRGVPVLVDGAQSTPHIPINVQELDADFYVFSGHKIFAPTGIGALYAKRHWLETLPAWQGGGHMIKDVTFEKTVFNGAPEKFEAGTPDIAGVVGLGAAIEYLFRIGIPALSAYEHSLLEYATQALRAVPGLRPIGTAANKASVLSFVIPGYDNLKIARYLDEQGIAVRAGHHCAQPAIRHFGLESSVRPSLAFYNTFAEVDALVRALQQLTRR